MSKKVKFGDAAGMTFGIVFTFGIVAAISGVVLHGIFGTLLSMDLGQFMFIGAVLGFLAASSFMQYLLQEHKDGRA